MWGVLGLPAKLHKDGSAVYLLELRRGVNSTIVGRLYVTAFDYPEHIGAPTSETNISRAFAYSRLLRGAPTEATPLYIHSGTCRYAKLPVTAPRATRVVCNGRAKHSLQHRHSCQPPTCREDDLEFCRARGTSAPTGAAPASERAIALSRRSVPCITCVSEWSVGLLVAQPSSLFAHPAPTTVPIISIRERPI